MFLVDSFMIYEVDPATGAELQRFPVQPAGTTPFPINTNGADVVVDPATGNLLVGTRSQAAIRELTVTGQFVRDQSLAGLGLGLDSIMGMAINATTGRLWLCDAAGTVYEVEALFSNSGNVTLAPASTLDVPGTFTQTAGGTLTTQVGGNPASGQFGRVTTTGPTTLGGTLGVNLVNGFGPVAGQQFSILTFPSATGSFSQFTGLDGGRLPLFTVDQLSQSVVLNAVGNAADLAFSGFVAATFPATAVSGENISVTYAVANLSDTPAVGDWFDSLYLSRDGSLDESDVLLGRVEHHGGVAATSTYQETLTTAVPPLANASYRILVLSDSRGLVPDGNRANNVGFSVVNDRGDRADADAGHAHCRYDFQRPGSLLSTDRASGKGREDHGRLCESERGPGAGALPRPARPVEFRPVDVAKRPATAFVDHECPRRFLLRAGPRPRGERRRSIVYAAGRSHGI